MFSFKRRRNKKPKENSPKNTSKLSLNCTSSSTTYSSLNLTSSLTTIDGELLTEDIPTGKVHLLGRDHPILIKKTVIKGIDSFRRSSTFTPSPSVERKRFFSQDEILGNENLNHFADRVEFGSNVLIIGSTNALFVAQVCRKAAKVIWYLGKNDKVSGYSSALDLESRIGRNGNLLVKQDFLHCDKFYVKGLFGRKGAVNEEIDFIYAEIHDQDDVIGNLFLNF